MAPMRITDVRPYAIWSGNRNFFFVKVETDAGLYGVGEGGLTWRELACARQLSTLPSPASPGILRQSPDLGEDRWLYDTAGKWLFYRATFSTTIWRVTTNAPGREGLYGMHR